MNEFGRQSRVFFDDSVSEYESADESNEARDQLWEVKRGEQENHEGSASSEHSVASEDAADLSGEDPDEVVMSDRAAVDERENGTVVG